MDKIIELELRIKVLEKIVKEIVKGNPLIDVPDNDDVYLMKMESCREMKKEHPDAKIEYPK